MARSYLHQAYDPVGAAYVYWSASGYDPTGSSYSGPPAFGTLVDITVINVSGGADLATFTTEEAYPPLIGNDDVVVQASPPLPFLDVEPF
jgi:hypothetical protein